MASISKQVDNTRFDLKASGVEIKAVFQAKPQKGIRNTGVVHLNARKSCNFCHVIVSVHSLLTFVFGTLLFASCFGVEKQFL